MTQERREKIAKVMFYQHASDGFRWENEGQWYKEKYLAFADQIIALDPQPSEGDKATELLAFIDGYIETRKLQPSTYTEAEGLTRLQTVLKAGYLK